MEETAGKGADDLKANGIDAVGDIEDVADVFVEDVFERVGVDHGGDEAVGKSGAELGPGVAGETRKRFSDRKAADADHFRPRGLIEIQATDVFPGADAEGREAEAADGVFIDVERGAPVDRSEVLIDGPLRFGEQGIAAGAGLFGGSRRRGFAGTLRERRGERRRG